MSSCSRSARSAEKGLSGGGRSASSGSGSARPNHLLVGGAGGGSSARVSPGLSSTEKYLSGHERYAPMSWLKAEAPQNIKYIVVTPEVSHAPMSSLKDAAAAMYT